MGVDIGILIKSSPPKGGVHKLMILLRDLPKKFLRKLFGEEMGGGSGGPRPPIGIIIIVIQAIKGTYYCLINPIKPYKNPI